jgi:hypothetical protein
MYHSEQECTPVTTNALVGSRSLSEEYDVEGYTKPTEAHTRQTTTFTNPIEMKVVHYPRYAIECIIHLALLSHNRKRKNMWPNHAWVYRADTFVPV